MLQLRALVLGGVLIAVLASAVRSEEAVVELPRPPLSGPASEDAGERAVYGPVKPPERLRDGKTSGSLRDVSFGKVFAPGPRADSLATDSSPSLDAITTDSVRDPYFGSADAKAAHWVAPQLSHRTLYFEDVALERFGVSWGPCLQPIVSGWRFFGDIYRAPTVQYYQPPHAVQYTLGYPRAGSPPDSVDRGVESSMSVGR